VSNYRIPSDRLNEHELLRSVLFWQKLFYGPVLIAQLDFKVKDLLAMALEAEVPGLDHTGMHRPDSDFMNLFTSDTGKKILTSALLILILSFNICGFPFDFC
jgi:hypothetical protein